MCKIETSIPSRSVESEPENVLNTRSPGRSSRWILPAELETPNRPTSSGLQSPAGVPVQFGPSPSTQEYVRQAPCGIPPAQWGDPRARQGDDGCELFGDLPEGDDLECMGDSVQSAGQRDELENAGVPPLNVQPCLISGARCINGNIVRPGNAEEEPPSTACRESAVIAPGGVALGRGPPGLGKSPGIIPGRQLAPPPPPPPPPPVPHASAASTAANSPRTWIPLNAQSKASGGGGPPEGPAVAQEPEQVVTPIQAAIHTQTEQHQGPMGQEEEPHQEDPGGNAGGSTPPIQTQQSGGAGCPGGTPPTPPSLPHPGRHSDPWAPLDRSRKALPKLSLPSN